MFLNSSVYLCCSFGADNDASQQAKKPARGGAATKPVPLFASRGARAAQPRMPSGMMLAAMRGLVSPGTHYGRPI